MSSRDVESAVKGLETAIRGIYKKYERRRDKKPSLPELSQERRTRVKRVLQHMAHCLTELLEKQASLKAGLQELTVALLPALLQRHAEKQLPVAVLTSDLTHFFGQLLRLHDGLILLVSGECRHAGDLQRAAATRFPSTLASQQDKSDGYTRLYSADATYSGASWDEFMDTATGLQTRLVKLLLPVVSSSQRDSVWDSLMDMGAAGLEAVLSAAEVPMQEMQQSFVSLNRQVSTQLQVALQKNHSPVSVSLQLADKMEKLRVVVGSHTCRLERRARAFQVKDAGGVLPVYSGQEWSRIFQLPELHESATADTNAVGAQKKKRRRVIQDSDSSSDDDDAGDAKPASTAAAATAKGRNKGNTDQPQSDVGGLVVQVQSRKAPKESSNLTSSVREIKQQMGVDVDGRAAASAGLEAEEADALRAASMIDSTPVDAFGSSEERHEIEQAECRVKRRKGVLKKVVTREIPEDNEIWDAREGLREALMVAGNSLLWASALNNQDRSTELKKAIRFFTESKDLVALQEQLHARMIKATNDFSDESRFYRRNLLLLRGQAQTNVGITMIELSSLLDERTGERKVHVRNAINELETAQTCARGIKSRAELDAKEGSCPLETRLDVVRALQLESLAVRWSGTALWKQSRRKESVRSFERGATLVATYQASPALRDEDIFEAELLLHVEAYHSWTTLADLASKALERTGASSPEILAKYDQLLLTATKALAGAGLASKTIQGLICTSATGGTFEAFRQDHELLTVGDLQRSRDEIGDWWTRRKATFEPIATSRDNHATLPRNDVFPDGPQAGEAMPTRRFVVSDDSRRRKKKRKEGSGTGGAYGSVGLSTSGFDGPDAFDDRSRHTRTYRKWGDELLPQTVNESGRTVPVLAYPAVAPEIPPYIAAILERQNRSG